jgi:small-conductance mechanosensitive channel
MEQVIKELIHKAFLIAPRVAIGLVVFFLFWMVGFLLQRFIHYLGGKTRLNGNVLNIFERTAKAALLIVGSVVALGMMGVNLTALVAGLGLLGFGLGFALRDVLSNMIAGILILIYCPLRLNDRVAVTGFEGIVTEIDLRYTTLQAEDKKILIPNSTLFSNAISVMDIKK